jgi:galactoside O-acetyltransferase
MNFFRALTFELNAWVIQILRWFPGNTGVAMRYRYYKRRFAGCGRNVNILSGCHFMGCENITLGSHIGLGIFSQIYAGDKGSIILRDHVYINSNVMINADCEGRIDIGPECLIGPNVVLRTSSHLFSDKEIPIRNQGHKPGAIIIKENVWIGANVTIIGNVTIGKGAIIAAGAIVVKDVADHTIVGGVPAKPIGLRG